MTCGVCGYEFCWACGESAAADDRHFSDGRGCGARQMDDTVKANSRKGINRLKSNICCSKQNCKNFWMYLGIAILFIIGAPFILVFSGPYASIMLSYDCLDNRGCFPSRYDGCKRFCALFLLVIIMGPIGFAVDAVTIPGLIIYGIFAGIY